MKRALSFLLCALFAALFLICSAASAVRVSSGDAQLMLDGKIKTCWEFDNGASAVFQVPQDKSCLLLRFRKEECSFEYAASDAAGNVVAQDEVFTDKIEYCLVCPEGCSRIELHFLCSNAICSADFLTAPEHEWLDAPEQTDILLISAHQDDELIFMGGLIPLFADAGKTVTVAYTAGSSRTRIDEALEGLWRAGVRHYPDFLRFPDYYREQNELEEIWGGHEYILGRFVELIRKRKPKIIVTHDINGEYGHGAHIYTSALVREAARLASDINAYPQSAQDYGTWEVKKLYIHLYAENSIRLDYSKPLEMFGGKTAAEMAAYGYTAHVSQRKGQDKRFENAISGVKYDSSLFGLYYSTVGYDTEGFFASIDENCDLSLIAAEHCWSVRLPRREDRTSTPALALTPTVTPTASPSPSVRVTEAASQTPTATAETAQSPENTAATSVTAPAGVTTLRPAESAQAGFGSPVPGETVLPEKAASALPWLAITVAAVLIISAFAGPAVIKAARGGINGRKN